MRLPILLLAAAVLVGCDVGRPGSPALAGVTPVPAGVGATAAPEAPATPQPSVTTFDPIAIAGEGKQVEEFTIPEGSAAVANITHDGESNFIVNTVDNTGDQVDGLVNEIGAYSGTVFIEPSDDQPVAFEIDADGAWTIDVVPIADAPAWDPSTTLEATGDAVYRVEPASAGLETLQLTYEGDSNFIVRAYSDGTFDDIANEIGDFAGEVLLPDGTFLLEVIARGGTWTATPS